MYESMLCVHNSVHRALVIATHTMNNFFFLTFLLSDVNPSGFSADYEIPDNFNVFRFQV